MLGAFVNAFRTPDLRRKLLFVLGVIVIFRFGSQLPAPGVNVANFLRLSVNAVKKARYQQEHGEGAEFKAPPVAEFRKRLVEKMNILKMDRTFMARYLNEGFSGGEKKRLEILQLALQQPKIAVLDETDSGLDIDPAFAERSVNEGFSGGEKKRHEVLQLALLQPKIAVLDETDSGLDVDALRVVSEGVNRYKASGDVGVLLITHYTRILRHITPDVVHVFAGGRIVESGGRELADELEANGYAKYGNTAAPATGPAATQPLPTGPVVPGVVTTA